MSSIFLKYPIRNQTLEQTEAIKDFEASDFIEYAEVNCVNCQSSKYKILFKNDRYGIRQQTVLCRKCGLVYTNPRMTEESTEYFYGSDLYRKIYGGISDIGQFERDYSFNKHRPKFDRYYPELFFEFLNCHDINYESVCEIGAGGGWNLIPFQTIGKKVIGYEPSPILVQMGQKRNLNLTRGFVQDFDGKFDLVILSHVLEHFLNPLETLRGLRKITKKFLAIEVPGFIDCIPSIQNAHNFYFSSNTLQSIVSRAGFRTIDLT